MILLYMLLGYVLFFVILYYLSKLLMFLFKNFIDKKPISQWLRWILVLPAAIGALIGIKILNAIFVYVYVGLGLGVWAELIINLFYNFASPYVFIVAGAKVAPSHRFPTSIALAAIVAVFLGFSIYLGHSGFVGNVISLIPLISITCACWKLYKECKDKQGRVTVTVL